MDGSWSFNVVPCFYLYIICILAFQVHKKPRNQFGRPEVVASNRLEFESFCIGSVFTFQIRHLEHLAGSEFLQPIRNGEGVVHFVVLENI